ncbi:hypothetical protein CFC21_032997, partial [Triticum aestivum]
FEEEGGGDVQNGCGGHQVPAPLLRRAHVLVSVT